RLRCRLSRRDVQSPRARPNGLEPGFLTYAWSPVLLVSPKPIADGCANLQLERPGWAQRSTAECRRHGDHRPGIRWPVAILDGGAAADGGVHETGRRRA